MCWEGKCFRCIPVERACLVLGIISAVSTGLGILACVIVGILIAGHEAARTFFPWEPAANESAITAVGIVAVVVGLASLIAFVFSVLLCNGICKRRPEQVKAYFKYGVTIIVLAVPAACIELIAGGPTEVGLSVLLGCAVYSQFLVLVYQAYMKMLKGTVFQDHGRLLGDPDNQSNFVSHG